MVVERQILTFTVGGGEGRGMATVVSVEAVQRSPGMLLPDTGSL